MRKKSLPTTRRLRELFGQVASVPTAWRALREIAVGGDRSAATSRSRTATRPARCYR